MNLRAAMTLAWIKASGARALTTFGVILTAGRDALRKNHSRQQTRFRRGPAIETRPVFA
jgi:hypothetical protein